MSASTGAFWRERLDTVLDAHHPEPAREAREHGILNSLSCRSRRRRSASRATATASPCRCSGIPTSASGSRRRAMRSRTGATRHRGADRRHRRRPRARRSCPTATSTAGTSAASPRSAGPTCATTTSSITPATARRRDRLLSGHRPAQLLDIMERYVDHIARDLRPRPGPEARLLRPPGDRARADQALPADRRAEAPRSRRLFHRRARPPAALFRRRGAARAARIRRASGPGTYEYNQSHIPVREQTKVVGHAVRAMYMYYRDGRPRRRARRRRPQARLRGAVARRDRRRRCT